MQKTGNWNLFLKRHTQRQLRKWPLISSAGQIAKLVQSCLLGYTASWWRQYAPLKRRSTIILHGSITQKTALNIILAAVRTWNLTFIKVSCVVTDVTYEIIWSNLSDYGMVYNYTAWIQLLVYSLTFWLITYVMLERRSENSNFSHKSFKCSVTDVAGKGHRFCQHRIFCLYLWACRFRWPRSMRRWSWPLCHCDRWFESLSTHGCFVFVCLCSVVARGLRDGLIALPKESYQVL
jgi:hypothetical protein